MILPKSTYEIGVEPGIDTHPLELCTSLSDAGAGLNPIRKACLMKE